MGRHYDPSGTRTVTRRKEKQLTGLVLDDLLREMDGILKGFHLPESKFGLKEIEECPVAKEALERLVSSVVKQNGSKIYSQRHPLFSGISPNVYAEPIGSRKCRRWRIREGYLQPVLRALFERALQTLVRLPSGDYKQGDSTRQLRTMASHLLALADEASITFTTNVVLDRIRTYYSGSREQGKERLFQIVGQMKCVGETLNTICERTMLIRAKMDSPNPQVRFALLILGWLDASSGGPQYETVKTLITGAFQASKLEAPKWVERLAIEMHSKRRRRMAWVRESLKFRHQRAQSQA